MEYLQEGFQKFFFDRPKQEVIEEYKRHCPTSTDHIEKLHDLGYLPIKIKALREGTLCPIGVPLMTITNTHPDHAWLVNYLETLISNTLWQPITSATIALNFKKLLSKYAIESDGKLAVEQFVPWQGHDFSFRGMGSPESGILSGMGHLTSFTGTDTIPAIYQAEKIYGSKGLIGSSVPATEHSVMCMGKKEAEIETFRRLLKIYPEGILSVVSDTWNLWTVLTVYLPILKDEIMARNGKLVIRPDSGNPVDIICGKDYFDCDDVGGWDESGKLISIEEHKGVVELLWDVFGGTINDKGYKVLDPHIGAIYGDSISLDRAKQISERLMAKGFASTNVVYGIGSYTYQYNTRDTFGFAVKATYGEIKHDCTCGATTYEGCSECLEAREIFKDPITDDGTKRSAKGLLQVFHNIATGELALKDQVTSTQEQSGLLETVFINGSLVREQSFDEIREFISDQSKN